ncbi:DCC1-like thiol-disulfide oxidoreductase family protein [Streptomyces sp. ADMS]|uniref:thiol-disulfide oxidoreductase DCC family protein n=1 Tax=Streptomyces sp. ADMS TaxID=3071415 RepID=UPI00296EC953|nr:DCC1-like thiol-disulfide oxidoreductase family protein [Streptomyces sp. ADMS]MDW4908468.1 DCC1-like thiol-disulfide oxidoreductase family protein [Streptomyces sp. ADMS]
MSHLDAVGSGDTTARADRDATGGVPVRRLTVLYDAGCALCTFVRGWLVRQSQLVPLDLVPAGSEQARGLFPGLDHAATLDDITVVGDGGQVYRGTGAWVVVLWALREYRPLARRFATPAGARLAKGAVLAAARWRGHQWGAATGGRPVYRRADGWSYDPGLGWTHTPSGCDSGVCSTG